MCMYWDVRKSGAFHIPIKKNRVSHIHFVEKRGLVIYLAALKKRVIRHAHSYYTIFNKLPPPLPDTHTHPRPHSPETQHTTFIFEDIIQIIFNIRIMCLQRAYSKSLLQLLYKKNNNNCNGGILFLLFYFIFYFFFVHTKYSLYYQTERDINL